MSAWFVRRGYLHRHPLPRFCGYIAGCLMGCLIGYIIGPRLFLGIYAYYS